MYYYVVYYSRRRREVGGEEFIRKPQLFDNEDHKLCISIQRRLYILHRRVMWIGGAAAAQDIP